MRKHTTQKNDSYEYSFWLTFDASGGVRLTRARPDVSRNERAVSAVALLPASLFKQPELRMTITVPASSVVPVEIDMEVAANALRSAVGMDFDIKISHERQDLESSQ